jgi:uncharacterized RDD family membrane protein YckC
MVTLYLAGWDTRFWAWLIDVILIWLLASAISGPLSYLWQAVPLPPGVGSVSLTSGLLFVYWTVLEGRTGQSIGKMAMSIRVTGRTGERIGYWASAVESFGKAFLLVLDCLIGWIAMPGSRERLFNRISRTIVIRTAEEEVEGVRYVTDED